MTNTEKLIENLALALADAREAARKAVESNPEDGGSCNFDAPFIQVPPRTRRTTVEAAARKAGVNAYPMPYRGSGYWLIGGLAGGQGNSRTRAAEAARQAIKEHDIPCWVHYQVD